MLIFFQLGTRRGVKRLLHGVEVHPIWPHEFFVFGPDVFIRIYDRRNMPEGLPSMEGQGGLDFGRSSTGCLKKLRPSDVKFNNHGKFVPESAKYNWNGSEIVSIYDQMEVYVFSADQDQQTCEMKWFAGHSDGVYTHVWFGDHLFEEKKTYVIVVFLCIICFIYI
jgi:hypothetical protein